MKSKIICFITGLFIGVFAFAIYDRYKLKQEKKKVIHVVLSNLDYVRSNRQLFRLSLMYKQIRENKDSLKLSNTFLEKKHNIYWDSPLFSTAIIIDTSACMILIHNRHNIGSDYILKNDTIYEVKLIPLELKIDTLCYIKYKNHWILDKSDNKKKLLPPPSPI